MLDIVHQASDAKCEGSNLQRAGAFRRRDLRRREGALNRGRAGVGLDAAVDRPGQRLEAHSKTAKLVCTLPRCKLGMQSTPRRCAPGSMESGLNTVRL